MNTFGSGSPHLLSLPSHLPVFLLHLIVQRFATRHQVLAADLAGSLLPHGLVALGVVLLLLLTVGRGGKCGKRGEEEVKRGGLEERS